MAECIGHKACDECGSSDNVAVYDDGSEYCFTPGCTHFIPSPSDPDQKKSKPKLRLKTKVGENLNKKKEREVKMTKILSEEDKTYIKEVGGFRANGFRGIKDEILKFYGVRTAVAEDGEVLTRYYPTTIQGELSGYKIRDIPKSFSSVGEVGKTCDMFGAFRFQNGGKYVLVVGGEEDTLAAYQMFKDYADSKNSEFVTAVVSATCGEGSWRQFANNYEFFNSFDNIILGLDADEAGEAGIEKAVSSLPKGKVKIVNWTGGKDPNAILMAGKQNTFIRDFYNAKPYLPAGVLPSSGLMDKIIEAALIQKVPLPPFMKKANAMIGGGIALGHIVNIAAQTSIGKTAIVNEMIYHWIFHSPHLVGVVSMELNSGQYGETLLSRHIQRKIAKIETVSEKLDFLNSEFAQRKAKELFTKENGEPRFYLVDDRDGTVEQVQEVIEQMIIASGVKIVVIDPLQDLIEGMSNEEQALFMKWCKSVIKSHNVTFILINHMRKKQSSDDSIKVSESDIMGSSTIAKSATINILLARDKEAEDPIERNTTYITIPKSRITGDTGNGGKIYYVNETHTMHDFDEYFSSGSVKVYNRPDVKSEPTKPEPQISKDEVESHVEPIKPQEDPWNLPSGTHQIDPDPFGDMSEGQGTTSTKESNQEAPMASNDDLPPVNF